MKVLVTGGTGFVGWHIQQELKRRNLTFFAFGKRQFDLSSWQAAERVFKDHSDADLILHLASFQAAGEFPAKHPAEQFYINNLIHNHVLEAWRRYIPRAKLIGIGASCAYPSSAQAMTEDKLFDGAIHGSVYAYGATKRSLATGILAYNDQFKLNGNYVIPAAMFGEHDDFNEGTAHVPGALIGRFVRAVKMNLQEVEIWGDGSQIRDFADVEDFVGGLLDLAPKIERDIVNVAPTGGTSIRELALTISEAAGFRGKIFFNPDRYTGAKEKFVDVSKLRNKFGIEVSRNLTPGIRRTVKWFSDNFDVLKDRHKFPNV